MSSVDRLGWTEVARRLAAGASAILPIGAGAKEHGFHLPMQTDQLQAEWLAAQLAQRFDALVWPTLTYGYYPAFVDYAGSASLSAETFEAVVRELAGSLLAYRARAVFLVDTGITTMAPVARAAAAFDGRVVHLRIYEGARYRAAAERLARQAHGGHADELETAQMLVIAPELVDMRKAEPSSPIPPGPGPMQHADPGLPNYSRSGSIGDPTLATRQQGEALLACMIEDLMKTVEASLASAGDRRKI